MLFLHNPINHAQEWILQTHFVLGFLMTSGSREQWSTWTLALSSGATYPWMYWPWNWKGWWKLGQNLWHWRQYRFKAHWLIINRNRRQKTIVSSLKVFLLKDSHILIPSSSRPYGRILSPMLKILVPELKIICSKNGGLFCKANDLGQWGCRFLRKMAKNATWRWSEATCQCLIDLQFAVRQTHKLTTYN